VCQHLWKGKGMWILFEHNLPFVHNLELLSGGRYQKLQDGSCWPLTKNNACPLHWMTDLFVSLLLSLLLSSCTSEFGKFSHCKRMLWSWVYSRDHVEPGSLWVIANIFLLLITIIDLSILNSSTLLGFLQVELYIALWGHLWI